MRVFPPNSFLSPIVRELSDAPLPVVLTGLLIVLSFSPFLILDTEWLWRLGREDGVFEVLTALSFLFASVILLWVFLREKNVWFLALGILLFVGAGEEVAWGQRIFGFTPPEAISKLNVQRELTIHNLEPLDSKNFDGTVKTGWKKLITINLVFRVFCVTYGVLLPLGVLLVRPVRTTARKIRLPIPRLAFGLLFVFSYLLLKLVWLQIGGAVPESKPKLQFAASEIYEWCMSFVWFVISVHFLRARREPGPAAREIRRER